MAVPARKDRKVHLNPHTYATLYGPWQPTPQPRPARPVVAALAAVVWVVTLASLGWLTFFVGMVAVWGSAAGVPVGGFLSRYALTVIGAAAALTALTFAPGVRRLAVETRLLIAGSLACPAPTALAIWLWTRSG